MTTKNQLYEFRTRRIRRSFAYEKCKATGPESIYQLMQGMTKEFDREHLYAIYLDVRGNVLGFELVAMGGLAGVEVSPREFFRGAILSGAHSVVMAHNHPSGDPEPSPEDIQLTHRFRKAGQLMGIELLDHVVVASGGYVSMADRVLGGCDVEAS
jgi:DNA repair protein RadC